MRWDVHLLYVWRENKKEIKNRHRMSPSPTVRTGPLLRGWVHSDRLPLQSDLQTHKVQYWQVGGVSLDLEILWTYFKQHK